MLTDYDKSGNVLSVTNALGDKHSYEYDIMGNVVKEISPNQAVKKLKYNVMSKLVELEDEQNNKTAYAYDKLDRLVKVTFADGTFQKQSYDKNSNIIATENVLGGKKVYTYDALNRLVSQTDEEGITNKLTYTATSQLASTIDGKGNVTNYEYDKLDRLIKEINAVGVPTKYIYDKRDNVIEIITKTGVNQEIINNLSNSENYNVNETEVSEKFKYNKRNELVSEISRLGFEKTYQYNKNGKLQSVVDEDGFKTNYKYDKNSNLIEKTITGGLLAKQQNSKVNYQYDQLNRLIKRVDNLYQKNAGSQPKVYSYSYDQQGNLLSEKDFEGKVTKLSYDKLNNLTKLTYPDNTVVNYTYDSMNRLQTVRDRKGTSRYSYDKLGRRVKLDFANGTTEAYSYDKKGRILTQLSRDKFNKKMASHRYEYDKNDNITIDEFKDYNGFLSKDVSIKSYGYDKLNQLTFDKVAKSHNCKFGSERRYYYDVAGNRVQIAETNHPTRAEQFLDVKPQVYITDYQYGKDNQLLKQRGDNKAIAHHKSVAFDFEYDKRGNLTAVKDPWLKTDSKYVAQYYYDGTNKLRYSTDKQNALTKYSYDGFGRRIAKESESNLNLSVTAKRIASQNGEKITEQIANRNGCFQVITTENYVYNPVSEYDDVLLRYGKNVKTERFVYGAKDRDNGLLKKESFAVSAKSWGNKTEPNTCTAKEVLSKQNNFATRYLTKDIRGSIENQSDEYGIKTACYKYTAFGVAKTIMDLDEVHGYAGYIRDRETNTYYVNARQYMPQTARFMAKDKLRVDSLNRYLYVVNNPVNMVDPSGIEKIIVSGDVTSPNYNGDNTRYEKFKYRFIETALRGAIDLENYEDTMKSFYRGYNFEYKKEQVTWLIINYGYSKDDIKKFKSAAEYNNLNLIIINKKSEFINYINYKSKRYTNKEARKNDVISYFANFSHGQIGRLSWGYDNINSAEYQRGKELAFTIKDILDLDKLVFSKKFYSISYACNTGTDVGDKSSFAQEWVNHTGGTMKAVVNGKTIYKYMNRNKIRLLQKYIASVSRDKNGFSYYGSVNYPIAASGIKWKIFKSESERKNE